MTVTIDAPTGETDWAALESLGVELAETLPSRAMNTLLHAWQVHLVDAVCCPWREPVHWLPAPFAYPAPQGPAATGCGGLTPPLALSVSAVTSPLPWL